MKIGDQVEMKCPPNMIEDVRNVFNGEYDIPGLELPDGAVILDIGANVGAFAKWALCRWPNAVVHCYEPNPAALEFLRMNVGHNPAVTIHDVAVTSQERPMLHAGKHNLGEASLFDFGLGKQSSLRQEVKALHPRELPPCAVLKMDTEGSEPDIWRNYRHTPTYAVMFEFHREEDKELLSADINPLTWSLCHGHIIYPQLGTLCYQRRT